MINLALTPNNCSLQPKATDATYKSDSNNRTIQTIKDKAEDFNRNISSTLTTVRLKLNNFVDSTETKTNLLLERVIKKDIYLQTIPGEIYHALTTGNSQSACKLIEQHGINIHADDGSGAAPLHIAVFKNNLKVVKKLIALKADINTQSNNGTTPLHIAISNEKADIVAQLINAGADMDLKNKLGTSPCLTALENGHKTIISQLIPQYIQSKAIFQQNTLQKNNNRLTEVIMEKIHLKEKDLSKFSQFITCLNDTPFENLEDSYPQYFNDGTALKLAILFNNKKLFKYTLDQPTIKNTLNHHSLIQFIANFASVDIVRETIDSAYLPGMNKLLKAVKKSDNKAIKQYLLEALFTRNVPIFKTHTSKIEEPSLTTKESKCRIKDLNLKIASYL